MKKIWHAGIIAALMLTAVGCGNAANNAGNAAGFVGNTVGGAAGIVGNTIQGTGNLVGGATRGAGNLAGDVARGTGNIIGGVTGNGGARADVGNNGTTQSIHVDGKTRTVDVHLTGASVNAGRNAGAGVNGNWPGTDGRATAAAGNWHVATITVPVGWTIRTSGPARGTFAHDVGIVPYNAAWHTNGTGVNAGAAGTNTWNGMNGNGLGRGAGGAFATNTADNVRADRARTTTLTATHPGTFAIVLAGAGYNGRIIDIVNVANNVTTPSITH